VKRARADSNLVCGVQLNKKRPQAKLQPGLGAFLGEDAQMQDDAAHGAFAQGQTVAVGPAESEHIVLETQEISFLSRL